MKNYKVKIGGNSYKVKAKDSDDAVIKVANKVVKDSIGVGRCAPVFSRHTAELREIEKHYNTDDGKRWAISYAKGIRKYVEISQKEVDEFDKYWKEHKKELQDAINEELSILNKIK